MAVETIDCLAKEFCATFKQTDLSVMLERNSADLSIHNDQKKYSPEDQHFFIAYFPAIYFAITVPPI